MDEAYKKLHAYWRGLVRLQEEREPQELNENETVIINEGSDDGSEQIVITYNTDYKKI